MDQQLPVDGRVALVTGAGRGLGAGIARALAVEGYAVVVNDLPTSAGAPAVVADIRAAGGAALLAVGDASDFADVQRMVADVSERLGLIDVFVANASGPHPVIELADMTWRDVEAHLALFVRSPMLITQAILPGMRCSGRGRIVLIGSDLVERAVPGWSAYAAAKAAMIGLTRTWARELGRYGITASFITGQRITVNGGYITT